MKNFFSRQRSGSIIIPDTPLNNIKICSGVAERILGDQFEDDVTWYRTQFNAFLTAYFMDDMKAAKNGDKNAYDKLISKVRECDKYVVNTNNKDSAPNSIATLVHADELEGEIGAIIQNAIIYSLAMCIVTDAKTPFMEDSIAGTSSLRGASNTKTPEEYRADMLSEHPRTSAIAETLGNLESKKAAYSVVTMMGYLIDKGDNGTDENEQQKVARIFDEQKIGT